MRRGLRLLAIVLLSIAGVVGAVALGIAVFGWNWARPYVERAVEARTDRDLELAGDLDVDLGSHPIVVVHDIRFGNPDWGRGRDLFRAERLEVRFAFWPLLRGKLHLDDLEVDGGRLRLERGPDGTGNWVVGDPEAQRRDRESSVELPPTVRVTDSVIDLSLPNRLPLVARLAAAEARTDGRQVRVRVRGALFEEPLVLEGLMAGPPATREDPPTRIEVTGRLGPTRLRARGQIARIDTFDGIDAELALSGQSLDEIWELTGLPFPESPRYKVAGRLRRSGNVIRFDDFESKLGSSDLSGDLVVELGGERPDIRAAVHSRSIDLDDIEGFWGKPPADEEDREKGERQPPGVRGHVFPDTRFSLAKLHAADADVRFRAARVQGKTLLENVRCDFELENGRLVLEPLSLGMAGGDLMVRGVVDARNAEPVFRAEAVVRGVDLARLLKELEIEQPAAGTIGGRAELASRGDSLRRMASELDGEIGVALSGGAIGKAALELVAIDLGDALVEKWKGNEPTPIDCAVGVFAVQDGVLDTRTLLVDTEHEQFTGKGKIDLRRERIDLEIDQHPGDFSIGTLRTPIEIEGGLGNRKARLQKEGLLKRGGAALALGALIHPAAALLALIEPGNEEKPGACANAFAELERIAEQPRPPQRPRRPSQRGG